MNPLVNEERQQKVEAFRQLLEGEIRPAIEQYQGEVVPRPVAAVALQKMAAFGVGGGVISRKYGGSELDYFTLGLLYEELACVSAGLAITTHTNLWASKLLDDCASAEICESYVAPTVAGEMFGCMAVTEPDAGSNVVEISMRADRRGDHYILNGEKRWVTNGEYSDYCVVTARTSDEPKGITHILVDRNEHGYEMKNMEKMGLDESATQRLMFSDVRVPVTNAIGSEGGALRNTLTLFEKARVFIGLTSLGIARAALEDSITYAKERKQYGKQIAGHQLVAARIAEMATHLEAARLLCHNGLLLVDSGVRCDTETSMVKWYVTENCLDITNKAAQIFAGNGYSKDYLIEKYVRDAGVMTIPDGTADIHKLLIARNLTGIDAF